AADAQDVAAYVAAFDAGDISADMDRSGTVDMLDAAEFMGAGTFVDGDPPPPCESEDMFRAINRDAPGEEECLDCEEWFSDESNWNKFHPECNWNCYGCDGGTEGNPGPDGRPGWPGDDPLNPYHLDGGPGGDGQDGDGNNPLGSGGDGGDGTEDGDGGDGGSGGDSGQGTNQPGAPGGGGGDGGP